MKDVVGVTDTHKTDKSQKLGTTVNETYVNSNGVSL